MVVVVLEHLVEEHQVAVVALMVRSHSWCSMLTVRSHSWCSMLMVGVLMVVEVAATVMGYGSTHLVDHR